MRAATGRMERVLIQRGLAEGHGGGVSVTGRFCSEPDGFGEIRPNPAMGPPSDSGEGRQNGALRNEVCMWLALAILFLIGWLIGFVAFHVTVAAIHILLGLFVIFLIIHFTRRAAAHA